MSLCPASIEYAAMRRSCGEKNCYRFLHDFKEKPSPSHSMVFCICGAQKEDS